MQKRQYLQAVKKYKPLGPWLWNDQPLFVKSDGCSKPLSCIGTINLLFVLLIVGLLKNGSQDSKTYILIDVVVLFLFDLFYLLAQFLNPGVLFRPQITSLQNQCYEWCQKCKMYYCQRDGQQHCNDCGVCVYGVDHHCAWFDKCISGPGKFGFYLFLIATFALVIAFMGSFIGITT